MKVAQINAVCGKGSTGKICVEISNLLDLNGIDNKIYFTSGDTRFKNGVKYSNAFYIKCMAGLSRLCGNSGFNSKSATRKLIKQLNTFNPDIIHLHNLHGHNVDLKLLFDYLSESNKNVLWTFHDCWPFTGRCPYFLISARKNKIQHGFLTEVKVYLTEKSLLLLNLKILPSLRRRNGLRGLPNNRFYRIIPFK